MYNIILKSVVYLSIIMSLFIVILYSGTDNQEKYYTWKDKKGVTHITKEPADIPAYSIKKTKEFNKTQSISLFYSIYNVSEQYNIYTVYLLFCLIFIFVILILLENIKKNILNYRKISSKKNTTKKLECSGILKISKNSLSDVSILIVNKLGYEIKTTDSKLNRIVNYTGILNGRQHGVSVIFSENPVSQITMSQIVHEGIKYDCDSFLVLSNNYFTDKAKKYGIENNMKLIDREMMAEYILKYGININ